jgi:hypothetical protein
VNGVEVDKMDPITGMNLIKNNFFIKFDDTCIRPIRCIMHKFITIKNPKQGRTHNIAYEVQDLRRRDRLVNV